MSDDDYIHHILANKAHPQSSQMSLQLVGQTIGPVIRTWADKYLVDCYAAGSIAKGTAIRGSADVDLFVSLSPDTPFSLKEIYQNLDAFLISKGYVVRKQNVSLNITVSGLSVDLVSGKQQAAMSDYHSIYRRKQDSWTQTNVRKHVSVVAGSGRLNEIRALKIWRQLQSLDFPSFYLEMSTITALKSARGPVSVNIATALQYFANNWANLSIYDPANTNNDLSDDLTVPEKAKIVAAARKALSGNWNQFIW